jgi:hypothetical protein
MEALSGFDMIRRREELEEAGATALGRLMFAFGRLEFQLGLAVRSIDNGKYLGASGFHARLESFERAINDRARNSNFRREPYDAWSAKAHQVRQIRNDLVHGRWSPDPESMTVHNVVTSPDLSEQRSTPYSVADLQEMVIQVEGLRRSLAGLVSRNEL